MPTWTKGENIKGCNLILSDDLDSLFSCLILEKLHGCKIEGFYNFDSIYFTNDLLDKKDTNIIGVDIDFANKLKCFGNHVTQISAKDNRENTANLNVANNINAKSNYTSKFAGNTLMQILSLYDVDVRDWTQEQKLVLCCIDSFFLPFTPKYARFKQTQLNYLKQLEQEHLGEFIQEMLRKHGEEIFLKTIEKYNLKAKIYINKEDGILKTNLDLVGLSELFNMPFLLPINEFKAFKNYKSRNLNINNITTSQDVKNYIGASKIISLAVTYRNSISYTYK